MTTDSLRPFRICVESESNVVTVSGPDAYRYVLRGAQSMEHAKTWARRLNDAYAMGYRAGVESAR